MSNAESAVGAPRQDWTYKPLGPIWADLQVLLWISASLNVLSLGATLWLFDFFEGLLSRGADAEAIREGALIDEANGALAIATLLVFVGTAFVFLRQTYYAMRNVHLLSGGANIISPRWAAGFYFIPIMNLWKPVQAMRQIWRASEQPEAPDGRSVPLQVGLWWFFWLASGIAGQAYLRMSIRSGQLTGTREPTIEELINIEWVGLVSDAASLPATLLAIWIWSKIVSNQKRTME